MASLLSGCDEAPWQSEPALDLGPPFCITEQPRRFTQEEWDTRVAKWDWNIRKDRTTNRNWEDFRCDELLAAAQSQL